MSEPTAALAAYLSLPDGSRLDGTARIGSDNRITFLPSLGLAKLPPEGLSVMVTVAGLPAGNEADVGIAGTLCRVDARELVIEPDAALPSKLLTAMAPGAVNPRSPRGPARQLLATMQRQGQDALARALRPFLVELGDQLFDLSTSSRYGIAGKHAHYDALNALKRRSETFQESFSASVSTSLDKLEKEWLGHSFADLEVASARSLEVVAFDEMDQKLAVDKVITTQIDRHRVQLESLTIRTALVAELDPRRAKTPFHPVYVVQGFVEAFEKISDSTVVLIDALQFFQDRYLPVLDRLYPELNRLFIEAGIELGLEDDIRNNGSRLTPVEKPIVKNTARPPSRNDAQRGDTSAPAAHDGDAGRPVAAAATDTSAPDPQAPDATADTGKRRDALYHAVLSALDTSGGGLTGAAGEDVAASPYADATGTSPGVDGTGRITLSELQLLALLEKLQSRPAGTRTLDDLPPLGDLVRTAAGEDAVPIGRAGANHLDFIDNVFRTLNSNYEVSAGMAPSLARLRVPLARLSLQEPRFFTQPEHPAQHLLDKLSLLASADHSSSRTVQTRVASIVERIARDYRSDSSVFADAHTELDKLLLEQERSSQRNVERVLKGLEGQERLTRAQRRVESLLDQYIDKERTPTALVDLLDGGWRSALVQLALREGEDSSAWRDEVELLEKLLDDLDQRDSGDLPAAELQAMEQRLRELNGRLNQSNPGSLAHERALRDIAEVLAGRAPLQTMAYRSPLEHTNLPDPKRVEQLPRLRRWLQRVQSLEPGARLRFRDRDGRRRQMRLAWVSEGRDRFAFVNERGQKLAELSAVQLARRLSRGAQSSTAITDMSVLNQSVYRTLEQAQKTLSFDRNRDRVTRLINGDALLCQLRRSLRHAQNHDSEHAFLLLDIDNFSLVNDVFDETSGDQVLSEFAQLLGQLNDRRALTARIEKDQFGILLTYRSVEDARRFADKIRTDIAASSLAVGQESVSFTVSIGIAPIARSTESPDAILEQARQALGVAKAQGRDQVVVYDLDQAEIHRFRVAREASRRHLEEAMSTDGLALRAQAIVQSAIDGSEGARHHYEILLSLRGDDGELKSPQDFIMSAERFGYITLVDRWVLRETFAWISLLTDRQKQIPELSINLSGTSITDNDFLDYVLEQISEYGVGTSRLCFEITETGAIDNLPRAADFVRTLKNIGCKFCLDDFGTGLASHRYLRELPVDYLKIDGTFVSDVHNNPTDFAMAKSINDLAHFLGQKTIAECVENLDIVPALRDIGVDYLQGWGVGMPRELHEILDELPNLET